MSPRMRVPVTDGNHLSRDKGYASAHGRHYNRARRLPLLATAAHGPSPRPERLGYLAALSPSMPRRSRWQYHSSFCVAERPAGTKTEPSW